jgi:excinuclease UvrABC ATPase subunit
MYEDLKCEFCDGKGEREVNIDGADCMCHCDFCNDTGIDQDQLEKLFRIIYIPSVLVVTNKWNGSKYVHPKIYKTEAELNNEFNAWDTTNTTVEKCTLQLPK